MPYNPQEQFDHRLIFNGIAGGGQNLGEGIADLQKKRKEAEAQAAGAMVQFQTLKQAKLLTPEEETNFLNGNANKKNAIVTSATPRLMQFLQTQKEKQAAEEAKLERQLKMQIAKMHWGGDATPPPPMVDPKTGLMWNGQQWIKPPGSSKSDPWEKNVVTRRGTLKSDGTLEGKNDGDMVEVVTPEGKTIIMPWKAWEGRTKPQQSSPSAPQAASGAAPVTPAVPVKPENIIEKNGHHYEVDHATKKVIRQID